MPGVDVLNTVVEMPEHAGGMIVMYVMFAIMATVFAGMCVYGIYNISDGKYLDKDDWVGIVTLAIIFLGCCAADFFLIQAIVNESHSRETIVYATIDDTVTWSELNERYEVVRHDGRIYQLRVREDEP